MTYNKIRDKAKQLTLLMYVFNALPHTEDYDEITNDSIKAVFYLNVF